MEEEKVEQTGAKKRKRKRKKQTKYEIVSEKRKSFETMQFR